MDLIDDPELPSEVEDRILELAAVATELRVDAGDLPGPAELLGLVDAVALLQATGELPIPGGPRGLSRSDPRVAAGFPSPLSYPRAAPF